MAKNELKLIISADPKNALDGVSKFNTSLQNFTKNADGYLYQHQKRWESITNLAYKYGEFIAAGGILYGLKRLATSAIDISSNFEQMNIKLDTLTKGRGAETFREINDWALDLGASTQKAVEGFTIMNAYGLEPTIKLLEILTNAASIFGDEAFTRISRAMGQIKSLGRLSQEEINQLSEVGVNATEILKRTFGQSVEEIQRSGRNIDEVLNAIWQGMGEKFEGAARRNQSTWRGLTTAMGNYFNELARISGILDVAKLEVSALNKELKALTNTAKENEGIMGRIGSELYIMTTNMLDYLTLKPVGRELDALFAQYKRIKEIEKESARMAERVRQGKGAYRESKPHTLSGFDFEFPAAFDSIKPRTAEEIKRIEELNNKLVSSLDITNKELLSRNMGMLLQRVQSLRDQGAEEILIEQTVAQERKKLIEEFVKNRAALYEDDGKKQEADINAIRETYRDMYETLGFDAKGYYDFRKGLLEKQRDEEIAITGDITLAWEAYYARQRELENERIRHSGSPMEGVKLFFDEESRKPQSWATEVEGGLADLKQGMKDATYSIVRDTESIGDAFKNMAMSILDSIAKIGTNMLVNSLFSMVGGVASGVSGAGTGTIGASYTGGAGTSGGTVGYNGMTGFTANSMSGGGTPIINNYITNNNNDIRANDVDSFRKLLRQNRGTLNEITVEGKRKNRNFEKQLKG
ncbi:hypothetical protein KsCSTR_18710 [Candidatus Kuenenia stuttgartiensis]|uniref:Tape measure protein N-terminal domain-containing protein n=1 Tax=Kuenenia stuttgartiensis TaxID=174633 RepID=A0A6G7GNR6_KUEST|nr:tape measure protein [Candidatus Kuenenia stuttgartiensis]QII11250.1 hypothetical protein KsCSTR_18710 [Candidatus Kuenenia stuttgartiensis]